MNSKKYPVINYVPTKVTTQTEKDLDLILKQMTYDTILNDIIILKIAILQILT